MKKAFIIGHHLHSKGAFSPHLKKFEWDFYMDMIQELSAIGEVFIHDERIRSYTDRMKNTANKINKKDFDLVIAVHFNSFDGLVEGCEALYYHTNKVGKKYSEIFCEKMTEFTGQPNRGAKELDNSRDRGFGELAYTNATTILLEPFFGDNAKDCEKFDKKCFLEVIKSL